MRQLILTIGLTCAALIVLGQQTNEFDSDRFYINQLGVDSNNIYMEYSSDSGDFYNTVYNGPSLAAIRLTFGIGYNF